jgi:hypothetical protein
LNPNPPLARQNEPEPAAHDFASWLAVTPVMSAIAFWLVRRKPAGAKQTL